MPKRRKIDVELGLQQVASMLRSGMTLLSSIKTAAEQSRRRSMRRIWLDVAERIQEGGTFADALSRYPRRFPNFAVQLVKVGEASGTTLDRCAQARASEQMERGRDAESPAAQRADVSRDSRAGDGHRRDGVHAGFLDSEASEISWPGRHKKLPAITQALLDGV